MTNNSELVFAFKNKTAQPIKPTDLASLGLKEREHLQSWVVDHPAIIGPDVMVVSVEYDKWVAPNGASPKDRLDILGLGSDGRLVVAELKRGKAPEAVELQAIKYAAMASRMSLEALVNLLFEFRKATNPQFSPEEALGEIMSHTQEAITEDTLTRPRIVLLAEAFKEVTTSSVIWLCEQGLDITMKCFQAYQTHSDDNILTVSQYYPVADVSEFQLGPGKKRSRLVQQEKLPEIPWSSGDLRLLIEKGFVMPLTILDMCSLKPGDIISSSDVYQQAGIKQQSGMGRMAGFGLSIRRTFGRSNFPWHSQWAAGGMPQQYYWLDETIATEWRELRGLKIG